ncbi:MULTISPECIES: flagellar hook protein FlgE [Cobetia]|uniref:flagellar hook protein FlgE n=1 Tax=Cobetia TaxID=204286 RepID=UPI0009842C5D|nr:MULTISPECIES: flagellar hook protein FlgE [Cobetia]POR06369.1 flagellar hook protein FlgE [Cobetia sp. MM1IDA2H-1]
MAFSQALSGLSAAATNLDVIGNNIANSETVGFKSSETQFADLYTSSQAAGIGVQVATISQDFSTGSLETTGRDLDLAISGEGFLRFADSTGQVVYSRNGQLNIDADGFIVNAQGAQLTGYAGERVTGEPVVLQVPTAPLAASATQDNLANSIFGAQVSINLDAEAETTSTTFDPMDPASYDYASAMTVYDSLGGEHVVTSFYTKTGNNTWDVQHVMDFAGKSADYQSQVNAGSTAPTVEFDAQVEQISFAANGQLADYTPTAMTYALSNGAQDLNFSIDLSGSTQYANDYEVTSLSQNGYTSGSLVGVSFEDDGRVIGSYSNELKQTLGTIALANFANDQGLRPNGDNGWLATAESGEPLVGVPGEGIFGDVVSGAVEASNVDLTTELVDLIVAQRNYQSNAQTIQVQDEVQQTVINLR